MFLTSAIVAPSFVCFHSLKGDHHVIDGHRESLHSIYERWVGNFQFFYLVICFFHITLLASVFWLRGMLGLRRGFQQCMDCTPVVVLPYVGVSRYGFEYSLELSVCIGINTLILSNDVSSFILNYLLKWKYYLGRYSYSTLIRESNFPLLLLLNHSSLFSEGLFVSLHMYLYPVLII